MAKTAGFCFGVKRAVEMVYNNTEKTNVYTYGPIIHNEEVVRDLEEKGVKVLHSLDEVKNATPGTVIIRAHGILQEEYDAISACGHEVVDATCPFVLKIHKIVKEASEKGETIVIVGDEKHPEVMGIKNCATTECYVVNSIDDVNELVSKEGFVEKKLCIVSQTTFNFNKFKDIVEIFTKNSYHKSNVLNTICNATEERQKEAALIAADVDAMIVIGGLSSSNTQKLYDICSKLCKNTFYIQTASDMDFSLLSGLDKVGITAGASTPKKIIEEVQTKCQI